MNIKQILKYLWYKPFSYYIDCLPYRNYTFEVKLKNIKDTLIYETNYILSLSFDAYVEILKYIKFNNKQYPIKEVEYTKLLKTEYYYAYTWNTVSDHLKCMRCYELDDLIKRQKNYIRYSKYINPKKLKNIIVKTKNYYV